MKVIAACLMALLYLVPAAHAQDADLISEAEAPAIVPEAPVTQPEKPLTIKGVTAESLEELMGKPTLLRSEHPAQLWQYADEHCVLQVYLYEPAIGGDAVVDYVEARMRGSDQPPTSVDQVSDCLAAKKPQRPAPDAAE